MNKYFEANAILSVFSKNYMDLKRGLPIRPSEMGVLNIITETSGPHTPVLLAKLLRVSKPMITAHLTTLLNKGYIEKQQAEDDKRVYYILPTEKAVNLVEKEKEKLNLQLEYLVKEMGKEKFDTFVMLAQKANFILDENRGDE